MTKLRENNPDANIICTVGPMVGGDQLTRSKEGIEYAMNKMNDSRISFLEFDTQKSEDGYGSDFHPSVKTHEKMSDKLTAEIKRIMSWD